MKIQFEKWSKHYQVESINIDTYFKKHYVFYANEQNTYRDILDKRNKAAQDYLNLE